MTVTSLQVNGSKKQPSAPLRNMALLDELVIRAMDRPQHLPGIIGFSGHSGFGKSTAAAYVAARRQADYIEVRSIWKQKAFLEELVALLRLSPERTIYRMMKQVVGAMVTSGRPLIIDEFDHAIDNNLVEIVRDIYEQTGSTIVLIGEEKMPRKLKQWERFDGRIFDWLQASAADLDDARALAAHYQGKTRIKDDLLALLADKSRGSVRRIVVNIERINYFARGEGLKEIGLAEWGDRQLYTGTDVKMREYQ